MTYFDTINNINFLSQMNAARHTSFSNLIQLPYFYVKSHGLSVNTILVTIKTAELH